MKTNRDSQAHFSQDVIALNRAHWNAVSRSHQESSFYDVEGLIAGRSSLSDLEHLEIGDISGAAGIHLQCGIGTDTISLARSGARMLGIDFSSTAVQVACSLARQCGVSDEAEFVVADVTDHAALPQRLFDFAYTSHGVLRWLPSLDTWAKNIAGLVRPGGFFYVFEIHPLVYHLVGAQGHNAHLAGDYFDSAPQIKQPSYTHAGLVANDDGNTVVHMNWTLTDIFAALLGNGLQIQRFVEHVGTSYSRKGLIPHRHDNLWYPQSKEFPMPLSFSIRCTRL